MRKVSRISKVIKIYVRETIVAIDLCFSRDRGTILRWGGGGGGGRWAPLVTRYWGRAQNNFSY